MTYQPSRGAGHLPPPERQEQESIVWGKVIGVGVAAVLLFSTATWFTWRFMNTRERTLQPAGPLPLPAELGEPEIGIVDQVPFDVARSLQVYRRDQLERLESWGWVDRKQGTIHMPIERAMDLVVEEHARKKPEGKGK